MKFKNKDYEIRHGVGKGVNIIEIDSEDDDNYPYWLRINIAPDRAGNCHFKISTYADLFADEVFDGTQGVPTYTGYIDKNNNIHQDEKKPVLANLIGATKHYLNSNKSFKKLDHDRSGIAFLKIGMDAYNLRHGLSADASQSKVDGDPYYYPDDFKQMLVKEDEKLKKASHKKYSSPIKFTIKNAQKKYQDALLSLFSLYKGASFKLQPEITKFLKSFKNSDNNNLNITINSDYELMAIKFFASNFVYHDYDIIPSRKRKMKKLLKIISTNKTTILQGISSLSKDKEFAKALKDLKHFHHDKKNASPVKTNFNTTALAKNILEASKIALPSLMKKKRFPKKAIQKAKEALQKLYRRSSHSRKMIVRTRYTVLLAYLSTKLYFQTNSASSTNKKRATAFEIALSNMYNYGVNVDVAINGPTGRLTALMQRKFGKLKIYHNINGTEVACGYFYPINKLWGYFGFRILPFATAYDSLDMDLEDRGIMTAANEKMEKRYTKIDSHPYGNHNAVMVYAMNAGEPARTDLARYVDFEIMHRNKMRLHMITDKDIDYIEKAIKDGRRGFLNPVAREWFLNVAFTKRGREKYMKNHKQ